MTHSSPSLAWAHGLGVFVSWAFLSVCLSVCLPVCLPVCLCTNKAKAGDREPFCLLLL